MNRNYYASHEDELEIINQVWNFPSNNDGEILGISDSGVETFNDNPIKSLAREICQNSIDAAIQNGKPALVEFKTFSVESSVIPSFNVLHDAIDRAFEFWSIQKSKKAQTFFKQAQSICRKNSITCLRISDFNTTGLTGSREKYNTPWTNLTKSQGASDKAGSLGGSFGIGKFAPFACSDLRTVFYSTIDCEGHSASQGVCRLTSFIDSNGDTTQGIGYLGAKKNMPIYSPFYLDSSFTRKTGDTGTDIFIVGLRKIDKWKEMLIASVLDGFLYAIYTEKLIVEVEDIKIDKENLNNLIISYEKYCTEHAHEYWKTLTEDKTISPIFEEDINGLGKVTLRMMIQPDFHRRVAMVRKTGMKIFDKGNISGSVPFAGILYIEGEEINEILRSMENPQHTKWEIHRAENQPKARNLTNALTKFLKRCLGELHKVDMKDSIDANVGAYLPDIPEEDKNKDKIGEGLAGSITRVEVRKKKSRKDRPLEIDNEYNQGEDQRGENVSEEGANNGSDNDSSGGRSGGGDTAGIGLRGDEDSTGSPTNTEIWIPVTLKKQNYVCTNRSTGEYIVSFVPSETKENGRISIRMIAEDDSYAADILMASIDGLPELTINGNRISGLSFEENKPVKLKLKLDYNDYCSLEIRADGTKK